MFVPGFASILSCKAQKLRTLDELCFYWTW